MPVTLYLHTPSGDLNLGDDPSDNRVTQVVLACLINDQDPWVELRNEVDDVTRWTVLERDEDGVPVQIVSEEFDGTTEVIENPYKEV